MIRWKPAVLTGLGSWLIPFAISFVVFPLRAVNPPLFETIMTLVVLGTAGALFPVYFRGRPVSASEALGAGALWVVINLMLDYPMFAFGPMRSVRPNTTRGSVSTTWRTRCSAYAPRVWPDPLHTPPLCPALPRQVQ